MYKVLSRDKRRRDKSYPDITVEMEEYQTLSRCPILVGLRAAVEGGGGVHPTLVVAVNTLPALALAVNSRQG